MRRVCVPMRVSFSYPGRAPAADPQKIIHSAGVFTFLGARGPRKKMLKV